LISVKDEIKNALHKCVGRFASFYLYLSIWQASPNVISEIVIFPDIIAGIGEVDKGHLYLGSGDYTIKWEV
jgi:hypothetical protein